MILCQIHMSLFANCTSVFDILPESTLSEIISQVLNGIVK